MLYTPALHSERAKKAWNYHPDAVILDLEDTIPPEEKENARQCAKEVISGEKKNWFARINPLHTSLWQSDVNTVVHENLSGIVIPKVEDADSIKELVSVIGQADLHINITVETVKGLMNLRSILSASKNIRSVTFGEGDFCLDVGIDWDSTSPLLLNAKCTLVFESRFANIDAPHDGVYSKLGDDKGLYESVFRAKSLGFTCKHCIHPSQINTIHEVLSPTPAQVERAKEIVSRFEECERNGIASLMVGSQFVDYPVYYRALKLLEGVKQ